MRWQVKQRMDFIGDKLRTCGTINRSDICLKFGVSQPQASADLTAFRKLNPKAVLYDTTRKTYVSTKPVKEGRDTSSAAWELVNADDDRLKLIAKRDPSMIRDVAAALVYERTR